MRANSVLCNTVMSRGVGRQGSEGVDDTLPPPFFFWGGGGGGGNYAFPT